MRTPSRLRRATLAAMPCVIAMALASCASAPQIALVGRLTVTPNALTFQDTAVGETSPEGALLVTNAGNIAVKFDRAAIGSADFVTSSGDCPVSTLAPGATCSLRLVFTPKTTGLRTTTATILSDATTAAPSVTLTGNGIVPTKVLTPTPAALNFSDTVVGTGARQDLLVLNTGTATVKVSAVGLSGPNASDFLTDTSFCGEPATPSGTGCTLSVSFTPSAPGPRSATLTITSDATGSPLNVKLTGKGVAPTKILSVTPKAINFPDTAVGEVGVTSGSLFAITNVGNTAVRIIDCLVGGVNPADFKQFEICPASLSPGENFAVSFAFIPRALGLRTATFTVTSDGVGSPQTVALTGSAVAPVKTLALTPNALSFPDTPVGGSSLHKTATLTNTGNATVDFSSAMISGSNPADFLVFGGPLTQGCGSSLPPGSSCTLEADFAPLALGLRTAIYSLASDATGSPNTLALTGSAIAPTKLLTVTPSSMKFPDTAVGDTTATQTVTVTNVGNSPIRVDRNTTSVTNFTDFLLLPSGTCLAVIGGATVAPGGSCTIDLLFSPTATGPRTGILRIFSDATGSPQTVSLTGNGAVLATKRLTLAPDPLTFPDTAVGDTSAARTLGLTNAGTATITVQKTDLVGGDFSFASAPNACLSIPVGGTCNISFTFRPTATGLRTATTTVSSDAIGSPQTVKLTGNGVPPTKMLTLTPNPLSFPDTVVSGFSSNQVLTITNVGNTTVNISKADLAGANPGDFLFTSGVLLPASCVSLSPGTSCPLVVQFAPKAPGTRTATYTVTSDAIGSPQTVNLTGNGVAPTRILTLTPSSLNFADTTVGDTSAIQTLTVTSTGTGTVLVGSFAIAGPNAGDFALSSGGACSTPPIAFSPGTRCDFTFRFAPTAAGARTATFTITSDATGSPQRVSLTGNGTTKILTAPSSVSFPDTIVGGTSAQKTVMFHSGGTAAVTIAASTLSGANPGDFKVVSNACFPAPPLAAGSDCAVTLTFNPAALGTRNAVLTVTGDGGATASVSLTGNGLPGTLTLTPNPMSFPDTTVGDTSQPQTLTMTNNSTATINISASSIGGDFNTIGGNACLGPIAIPPGKSCTVSLRFAPTATGARMGTFTVTSDGAGSPQTVKLTGNGLAPTKILTLTPDPVNPLTFPDTPVGSTSSPQALTITNTGTGTVTLFNIGPISGSNATDFSFSSLCIGPTLNTLAPGASCTVNFQFAPTATGARSATFAVTSDATGSPQTVTLTGTGTPPNPKLFSIGGTITGLTHAGLVLSNGSDTLSLPANATSFVFAVKVPSGTGYAVGVKTQPIAETCELSRGTGTVGTADVTNIDVGCGPHPPANWVWKSGSDKSPAAPVYGTQGTPAPGNVPGRRDSAVSWIDASGDLWLLGGRAADSQLAIGANNDLWRYRPADNDWTWMSGSNVGGAKGIYGTLGTPGPGTVPGARENAFSWSDGAGNLWLFGGLGFDSAGRSNQLNDLWKYDVATGEWTWTGGNSVAPYDAVYGSQGVPSPASVPGGRDFGVTWIDSAGNLWLFGGEGSAAPPSGCACTSSTGFLADLWKFSTATRQWTWISGSKVASNAGGAKGMYGSKGIPAPTNAPGHRTQAVSWTDTSGNLWLFGGVGFDSNGSSGLLNDLWKYDIAIGQWTWMSGSLTINATAVFGTMGVPSSANVPDARQQAISWADEDDNLWLFGGSSARVPGVGGRLNDLWQYNIGTGEWTWFSGSPGVNAAGVYGTLGGPASTNVPGGRSGGVSWVDASGNLWHFGGLGFDSVGAQDFLNDLWLYAR